MGTSTIRQELEFGMATSLSPSPILALFVRNVQENFPLEESAKADQFSQAISHTTSDVDPGRARRCFLWAFEMADAKEESHSRWREIKELHQEWKDTWFGLEFGLVGPEGAPHTPREDIHIQWVEDAVSVAKTLGEEEGWEKSQWQNLLRQLIEMGDDGDHEKP